MNPARSCDRRAKHHKFRSRSCLLDRRNYGKSLHVLLVAKDRRVKRLCDGQEGTKAE